MFHIRSFLELRKIAAAALSETQKQRDRAQKKLQDAYSVHMNETYLIYILSFKNYTMVQQTFQLQVMVLINANPQLAPIYLSQVTKNKEGTLLRAFLADWTDPANGRRRQERPGQSDRTIDESSAAKVDQPHPQCFPLAGATMLHSLCFLLIPAKLPSTRCSIAAPNIYIWVCIKSAYNHPALC